MRVGKEVCIAAPPGRTPAVAADGRASPLIRRLPAPSGTRGPGRSPADGSLVNVARPC